MTKTDKKKTTKKKSNKYAIIIIVLAFLVGIYVIMQMYKAGATTSTTTGSTTGSSTGGVADFMTSIVNLFKGD